MPSCRVTVILLHPTRGRSTPIEINVQHIGVDPTKFARSCFLRSADLRAMEFVIVPCDRCGCMVSQTIALRRDDGLGEILAGIETAFKVRFPFPLCTTNQCAGGFGAVHDRDIFADPCCFQAVRCFNARCMSPLRWKNIVMVNAVRA